MEPFAVVDALDRKKWERFVCYHPKGSIFHTPEIYEVFQGTKHHSPLILAALDEKGDVLALLLAVNVQTLPDPLGGMASRSILYAEPLCREDQVGQSALAALLSEHDARMHHQALFAEIRPLQAAGAERAPLEQCGYRYEEYLNFLIDLTQPPETLWRGLTESCRKSIKRGQKERVRIEEATTESGLAVLYDLVRLTYARARVPLADKSLFEQAYRVLAPKGFLKIFVAYLEDEPIGASVVLLYKRRLFAWYYGGKRIPAANPAECLTWHRMQWGHENGFALYDFGGAGWPNQPYGVRDFKAKFGGDLVQYGRYRKVYSPWKLAAAEKGYGLLRQVTNPTRWTKLPV